MQTLWLLCCLSTIFSRRNENIAKPIYNIFIIDVVISLTLSDNCDYSTALWSSIRHLVIVSNRVRLLQAADLSLYDISEHEMKAVFQKLDTDEDGHLLYQQVEPEFPKSLAPAQKKYLKQVTYIHFCLIKQIANSLFYCIIGWKVLFYYILLSSNVSNSLLQIYDITSASTFFGVKEFVTIKCLCEEVAKLDHELMLKGFAALNYASLTTTVIQYTVRNIFTYTYYYSV